MVQLNLYFYYVYSIYTAEPGAVELDGCFREQNGSQRSRPAVSGEALVVMHRGVFLPDVTKW